MSQAEQKRNELRQQLYKELRLIVPLQTEELNHVIESILQKIDITEPEYEIRQEWIMHFSVIESRSKSGFQLRPGNIRFHFLDLVIAILSSIEIISNIESPIIIGASILCKLCEIIKSMKVELSKDECKIILAIQECQRKGIKATKSNIYKKVNIKGKQFYEVIEKLKNKDIVEEKEGQFSVKDRVITIKWW